MFILLCWTEYNSDLSCHYKVELSFENLVTSGPEPHPPPIADDESDDEDDDDVPRVSGVFLGKAPNSLKKFPFFIFYFVFVFDSRRTTMPCL